MDILICTDGSIASLQSAELVIKLGFPATTRVVILGVSEKQDDLEVLSSSISQLKNKLMGVYHTSTKIRYGKPFEEILAEALEFQYDLVAVGGAGMHVGILNSQLGSTTSKLARKLHTHFLVTRDIPAQFGKVLVCASAEASTSETMKVGGAWISHAARQITLLHVIPTKKKTQPPYATVQTTNQILLNDEKLSHDLVLERAAQQLCEAGVGIEIIPKIRQGLIVDQVLEELSEGDYDLLVVGAHYRPGQDRWLGTLLDDITDQLLNRSVCSVLII
ncbi:MAG: universal stress protein [Anaerolineales bacterium]